VTNEEIVDLLTIDPEFRRELFRAPRVALETRRLVVEETTLRYLEREVWCVRPAFRVSFGSAEVLRCSVGF
jgi:hypothetical protein